MNHKTIIVSFSSRKSGNCGNMASRIADILGDARIYCFSDFKIQPCGACQYECFQSRESCPYFDDMECSILEAICESEMTYFVVPNYCDYPCANFFIFNERSQCFFQGRSERLERYLNVPKKFIVVSNGTEQNFREAFMQHSAEIPEVLFLSPKKYGKNSIDGNLLDSRETNIVLEKFLR